MKRKEETKYLNKILSAVLIFLIILMQTIVFPIQSKAEESYTGVTLTMEPVTSLNAGDKVVVKISTTGQEIGSMDCYITYDMSVFEEVTEDNVECLIKNWGVDSLDYDEDSYGANTGYLIISNSKGQVSKGDIATITLTLKKNVTEASFTMKDIYVTLDNNDSAYQEGELECNAKLARKYTITYNANTTETVTGMPSNGEKSEGANYTIAAGPKRANYTFKGWNTNSNGTGTAYAAGSEYSKNENLTLYAQWKINQSTLTVNPNGGTWNGSSSNQTFTQGYGTTKTIPNPTKSPNGYIVKFNSNGGTTDTLQTTSTTSFKNWTLTGGGTISGTTYTFKDKAGTLTANYNPNSITLPTATKTGATFKGWYTSTTGGTRVGGAGDNYTPKSAVTLSAQWEENEYTLTVNPNGGTWNGNSSIQTIKGKYNSTKAITNPNAPNGYIVTLNNNGETSQIQQTKNFDRWIPTGNGKLEGIVYTFLGDGQLTATYTENNVELPTPTKTGYTFNGWYTLSSGGTKVNTPYKPTSNVTLYAHWTANEYTVTFNPGDKGTVSPTSKKVTYNQLYGELPTPVRQGYKFVGWFNSSDNKVENTTTVKITKNETLTAKWLGAEYTVTFNPDGGEVTPTSKKVQNEGKYGELPTPTKTGYTFNGWYNTAGTKIESTTTVNITSNETLTARWSVVKTTLTVNPNGGTWEESTTTQTFTQEYNTTKNIANPTAPKGYTIKFDGNGGNTEQGEIIQSKTFDKWTLTDGKTLSGTTYTFKDKNETIKANYIDNSITLPTVTKAGATFKGWYTSKTGGTKVGDVGATYKATNNVTLYAQWEENEYTLTVNPNGGTWNGSSSIQTIKGKYNSTKAITNPTAPNGYIVTLNNNGETSQIQQTKNFDRWIPTGNGKLEGIVYTFLGDGQLTATYTENNVELPTPTKTGYTFNGWYTLSSGGTKVNTPYKPTSNVTLYAHWTANEYTVTFNPGDKGTVSPTSKKVTYNQLYGELPTPVRQGYKFVGWFNSSDNKVENTTTVKITKNETLTAKWLGAEYTVTFNPDGGEVTPTSKKVQNEGKYGELPTPTKTGYTFNGWYNTAGTKIESTTTVNITSNETLTARWSAVKTTLTVNPNGGTWEGSTTTQTFTQDYNTTKNIPNPTAPKGYTVKFDGNGGNTEQSEIIQSKTFDKWTLTDGKTLSGTTYTFKDKNETIKANYIDNSITLPTVTKAGATFKGWYTSKTGGTKVGDVGATYKATNNVTLYAQWEEVKYTLTIDPKGGTINGSTNKKTVEGGYNSTTEVETPVAPNKYKVTLDNEGNKTDIMQTTTFAEWKVKTGTGTISNSTYTFGTDNGEIEATYTENNVELPTPSKTGYTFNGWYTLSSGGTKVNTPYKPTSNVTLYAHWTANEYTVTFNPDGGEVTPTSKKVQNEGKYGELPTPTKTGYTFNGWYNVSGTKIESTTTVNLTSDETLTAKWDAIKSTLTVNPNEGTWEGSSETQTFTQNYNTTKNIPNPTAPKGYTVKFDGNGGNTEQSEIIQSKSFDKWTLTDGKTLSGTTYTFKDKNETIKANYIDNSITLPTVMKEGATFKGWYTSKTGGTKVGDVGATYKATNNVTLYAQWEEVKYTLTIDPKGGTINGSTNKKTVEGGYNSTTEVETPVAPNKYKVTLDNEGNKTDIMQTTTFAGWKVKTGTGTISNSTYTFGTDNGEIEATYTENNVELPTLEKEGYTFDGWYTEKTGGTKINTKYVTPVEDVTLYAHWTANEYTITFNPRSGATLDTTSKNVTYNQPYGELPTPIKEGYTFIGWFDSNNNKIESDTIVKITKNSTLTAKYEVKKYTVTYKNDDGSILTTEEVEYGKNAEYTGETPIKENVQPGYEGKFIGWDDESKLQNIKQDITVTAKYDIVLKVYTIKYRNIKESDNSANPIKYTIEDSNIKLVDLQNQGKFIFKGWYTEPDSSGIKVESIDTSKMENIILYAQWENDGLYLSSRTYKVGEKDIDNYEDGDIYLDKIRPETTLSEFIDNCITNGKITVINQDGKVLRNSDYVGTNMTIKVTKDDEEITMTAVVMGDLSGDGRTTAQDLATLNQAVLGMLDKELEGAVFKAADIDDNMRLTATDLSAVNGSVLKITPLTYKKNK